MYWRITMLDAFGGRELRKVRGDWRHAVAYAVALLAQGYVGYKVGRLA